MKLVSWNVNGLRACLDKGFKEAFAQFDADVFCLQETKMQEGQVKIELPGYHQYWNSAEKKGYSGTAVFSREEGKLLATGFGTPEFDTEGRILVIEYEKFILVNVYTPNSRQELKRLSYRMKWEDRFRVFLRELDKKKPLIICGDMNVAHQKIDLKNPGPNRGNAGFTDEERDKMTTLLGAGFTDTFRKLYPLRSDAYSWWSYRAAARERNIGWRIDYFLVSNRFMAQVEESSIHSEVTGSDHCPVMLTLKSEKPPIKTVVEEIKTTVKRASPQQENYFCTISGPIGQITAASDGSRITGLWLEGQKHFGATLAKDARETELAVFERLRKWLVAYFAGRKPSLEVPLAPQGSEFRQAVWKILQEIPYGGHISYGDITKRLQKAGMAASAQAVGGAVGHNPISILIPCHRVVGSNGSLTGYASGIEKKIYLLKLEGVPTETLKVPTRGTAL